MSMDKGGRPDRPVSKTGMRMREVGGCGSALKLYPFMGRRGIPASISVREGLNQKYDEPDNDEGDKGRYVQAAQVGQQTANGFEHRICDGVYYSDEWIVWIGIYPGDESSRNDDVAVNCEEVCQQEHKRAFRNGF